MQQESPKPHVALQYRSTSFGAISPEQSWPNPSLNRSANGRPPGGAGIFSLRPAGCWRPLSSNVRPRRNQIACRRQYQLDDAVSKGKLGHLLSTLAEKLSQKDSFKIASRVILWRNQTPMALRAA